MEVFGVTTLPAICSNDSTFSSGIDVHHNGATLPRTKGLVPFVHRMYLGRFISQPIVTFLAAALLETSNIATSSWRIPPLPDGSTARCSSIVSDPPKYRKFEIRSSRPSPANHAGPFVTHSDQFPTLRVDSNQFFAKTHRCRVNERNFHRVSQRTRRNLYFGQARENDPEISLYLVESFILELKTCLINRIFESFFQAKIKTIV